MKSIFIDAKNQTVCLIEVENDLQAMYDKIGCLLVQTVPFAGDNIVCDEEGRCKRWTAGFELGDWRIVGNALIVGDTEDGAQQSKHKVSFQTSINLGKLSLS